MALSVVLQGRDVADLLAPFLGAQDAAHDLARARLGQPGDELDLLGHGQGRELLASEVYEVQLKIILFDIQFPYNSVHVFNYFVNHHNFQVFGLTKEKSDYIFAL